MAYVRVNWADSPSTATPIDAANLNTMDAGIATLDTTTPKVGTHNGVTFTISAGTGAPVSLAANEIYIQLS